eukprot:m51a1_g10086 putative dna mismatch repair protein (771) ;mRNA; r:76100-80767
MGPLHCPRVAKLHGLVPVDTMCSQGLTEIAAAQHGDVVVSPLPKMLRRIDAATVRKICGGQVIVDLASALKELLENALDAGSTRVDIVSDDGCGIDPQSLADLALPHTTSKLASFGDLERVATLGFRGEALNSLCAVCGGLAVATRRPCDPAATRARYDRLGALAGTEPASRAPGTTVALPGLFAALPARRAELSANAKRELARALAVLQPYAVARTGVRISVSHAAAGGQRAHVLLRTEGRASVRENVVCVFGAEVARRLCEVEAAGAGGLRVRALVPRSAAERPAGGGEQRQMFFVNGRPVDLPLVARAVTALYREGCGAPAAPRPFVVALVDAPAGACDVNVTPDKRTVLLHEEEALAALLREALARAWGAAAEERPFAVSPARLTRGARAATAPVGPAEPPGPPAKRRRVTEDWGPPTLPAGALRAAATVELAGGARARVVPDARAFHERPDGRRDVAVDVDCQRIVAEARRCAAAARERAQRCGQAEGETAGFSKRLAVDSNEECERELELRVHKSAFGAMRVVGQFNRGFVVARLGRELFVVDQHAADEIANYERLRASTRVGGQRMLRPIALDLAPEDVLVAEQHLPLLRQHGFGVEVDDEGGRKRLLLTSCCSSKSTLFGVNDLYEVIAMIREGPPVGSAGACEPSRFHAMFAMRACRRSVMIGTALTRAQMQRIVRHLGELEKPWRCPHGRPTMRHIYTLALGPDERQSPPTDEKQQPQPQQSQPQPQPQPQEQEQQPQPQPQPQPQQQQPQHTDAAPVVS